MRGSVLLLAQVAAEEKSAVKTAAENALAELAASGVDEAILHELAHGTPASRVAMINAAALRSLAGGGARRC